MIKYVISVKHVISYISDDNNLELNFITNLSRRIQSNIEYWTKNCDNLI